SLIVVIVSLVLSGECVPKAGNYSIGFEGFNSVGTNNHTSSAGHRPIGFENVHNRTYGYYTTPPPKRYPISTIKPSRPKVTKSPARYVTTMSPSKIAKKPLILMTTLKPSSTRKPPTTKPPKPKATHPTTKKPTVPTLPPSIYVKPNISKVLLPPRPPMIVDHTSNGKAMYVTTTINPIANAQNWDFTLFHHYLQNFTSKAEHTKQTIHQPTKGDTFSYYYDISHYYKNPHKASSIYKVQVNNIRNCATNTSKVMCLPNTNALCLTNGTIMCVTHLSATISCENGSKNCAITYVPCDVRFQTCPESEFYVGVPCVSNVLLLPSSNDFYQHVTLSPIEYCVTSVIQPKRLYSAVGPLFSILFQSVKKQYEMLSDNIFRYNNPVF
ncbi:hypothetical protein PPYR_07203, partial [Photinus pyralis]